MVGWTQGGLGSDALPVTQRGWDGSAGMAPKWGWAEKGVSKWSCGKDCVPDQGFF